MTDDPRAAQHLWIVYDQRANPIDGPDEAAVLVTEHSERKACRWPDPGEVWRYDISGDQLINETYVGPTLAANRGQR